MNGDEERSARRSVDLSRDQIRLDGRPLTLPAERLVLAFHKPTGLLTTRVDPRGRPTIYEALRGLDRWVFPAGRLDRETSGLLILTNDSRLSRHLTDPRSRVPKTYHARVQGHPDEEALRALGQGVDLGGGVRTRPAIVRPLGSSRGQRSTRREDGRGSSWLEIVLTEGRKHQVRRLCARVGHDVLTLVRVRIGHLDLGDLPEGGWRMLGTDDVERLAPSVAESRRLLRVRGG